MIDTHRRKTRRKNRGYALLVTLVIGLTATMFLLATSALMVPLLNSTRISKSRSDLDDAAKQGLRYAVKQLNDAYINNRAVAIIDPSSSQTEKISSLPSAYIPDSSLGTSVMIRVKRPDMDVLKDMKLYDSKYDPTNNRFKQKKFGELQNSSLFQTNYWRIIEVTATRGGSFSSVKGVIRPDVYFSTSNPQNNTTNPMFANPLLAHSNLTLNSPTVAPGDKNGNQVSTGNYVDSSGSMNLKLQCNGKVNIGTSGNIYADLNITHPTSGAPQKVLSASNNSGTRLWGRVTSNSGSAGVDSTTIKSRTGNGLPVSTMLGTDNVLASGELYKNSLQFAFNGRSGINTTPIPTGSSTMSTTTNPVPSAPSNAQKFPPFPETVGSQQATQTQVAPGTYKTSGLDSSNADNSLVLSGSSSSSWTLHLTDENISGSQDNVVNLSTSKLTQPSGMKPSQLQIFYDGERPIQIKVDTAITYKAMIFAPKSKVSFTGIGKFSGAVVGNEVSSTIPMILVNDGGKSGPSIEMTDTPSMTSSEPILYHSSSPDKMPFKTLEWYYVKDKLVN
ncbi:MAG: hypothetical protein K2Z81_28640 [Cyanobacteria bacterium]|nr:hypothetical protein [Cyanobacteriota bacterium]